jgi:hypothetical protein
MIWDFDSAIGQVNATYPYNFNEQRIVEESTNVDTLLAMAGDASVRMTFACVGFAAESGVFPYHVPEQIRRIRAAGHEIASHSWRHEWFPFLEKEQVRRSLDRSKAVLEQCLGEPGAVRGFVPPFSRPMTWYRKGALSLGDRGFGPMRAAADIGSLCEALRTSGYVWCRVAHRSLVQRLTGRRTRPLIGARADRCAGIACLPQHYTGFDAPALALMDEAIARGRSIVINAHPSGLSRNGAENFATLRPFLARIAEYQAQGRLAARTVSDHLAREGAVSA